MEGKSDVLKEELSKYTVVVEFPVQWGEMDAANHVNNLIYLRWSESARLKYFEHIRLPIDFKGAYGPILGWQDCKYIFPVTYPDTVVAGSRVIEILKDRFVIECGIYSLRHQRIAAISKQQIIPYSYTELKKVEMPESWISAIKEN